MYGAGVLVMAAITAGLWYWQQDGSTRYLPEVPVTFPERFAPPPSRESPETRRELDELLKLQSRRTAADVAAARADRKTEIARFYGALGLDERRPPDLPRLERLAERVEDDVRLHVRAVKERHRRLRPYEIEPRLEPCIDDVAGDLSYPSGHAAFAWSMAYLLSDLVPERRAALEARAAEFAHQRMVCGVHFPSDLEAGRQAAARLREELRANPRFLAEVEVARAELRAALNLPDGRPRPRG
jgi:acid phosphatase (class A)